MSKEAKSRLTWRLWFLIVVISMMLLVAHLFAMKPAILCKEVCRPRAMEKSTIYTCTCSDPWRK